MTTFDSNLDLLLCTEVKKEPVQEANPLSLEASSLGILLDMRLCLMQSLGGKTGRDNYHRPVGRLSL